MKLFLHLNKSIISWQHIHEWRLIPTQEVGVISFTRYPLYVVGKCHHVLAKQEVFGPESRLEYLGRKTGFVPLPGKEPRHI
jgi:hypothetical protein